MHIAGVRVFFFARFLVFQQLIVRFLEMGSWSNLWIEEHFSCRRLILSSSIFFWGGRITVSPTACGSLAV